MNNEIFTVLDQAAQMFLEPFFSPTVDAALRGFKEACTKEGHQFQKFPEDYALYHIGTYDAELGMITPIQPHKIGMATSFAHHGTDPHMKLDGTNNG